MNKEEKWFFAIQQNFKDMGQRKKMSNLIKMTFLLFMISFMFVSLRFNVLADSIVLSSNSTTISSPIQNKVFGQETIYTWYIFSYFIKNGVQLKLGSQFKSLFICIFYVCYEACYLFVVNFALLDDYSLFEYILCVGQIFYWSFNPVFQTYEIISFPVEADFLNKSGCRKSFRSRLRQINTFDYIVCDIMAISSEMIEKACLFFVWNQPRMKIVIIRVLITFFNIYNVYDLQNQKEKMASQQRGIPQQENNLIQENQNINRSPCWKMEWTNLYLEFYLYFMALVLHPINAMRAVIIRHQFQSIHQRSMSDLTCFSIIGTAGSVLITRCLPKKKPSLRFKITMSALCSQIIIFIFASLIFNDLTFEGIAQQNNDFKYAIFCIIGFTFFDKTLNSQRFAYSTNIKAGNRSRLYDYIYWVTPMIRCSLHFFAINLQSKFHLLTVCSATFLAMIAVFVLERAVNAPLYKIEPVDKKALNQGEFGRE